MVAPCRCKGSMQYVHQACLKEWSQKRLQRPIIPGYFNQHNLCCEICRTGFRYKSQPIAGYVNNACWSFSVSFACISAGLFASYLLASYFLVLVGKPGLFIDWPKGKPFETQLLNGFILVHLCLLFFYVCVGIYYSCMSEYHTGRDINGTTSFMIGYSMGSGCDSNCGGEGCIIVLLLAVVASVVLTVIIIYFDVLHRLNAQLKRRGEEIIAFVDYIPPKSGR